MIGGVIEMDGFRDTMSLPRKVKGVADDADTADKLGLVIAFEPTPVHTYTPHTTRTHTHTHTHTQCFKPLLGTAPPLSSAFVYS